MLFLQVVVLRAPAPRSGRQPPGDVQITFYNAYMTRQVNAGMKQLQTPMPFQDVTVHGLDDQNIQMNGYLLYQGQRVPAQVTVKPIARDGRVAIQVVGAQLGVLRVPPEV